MWSFTYNFFLWLEDSSALLIVAVDKNSQRLIPELYNIVNQIQIVVIHAILRFPDRG